MSHTPEEPDDGAQTQHSEDDISPSEAGASEAQVPPPQSSEVYLVEPVEGEAVDFLRALNQLIRRLVEMDRPAELVVLRTAHWFEHTALGPAAGILASLGVEGGGVRVPSFSPADILEEMRWVWDEEERGYRPRTGVAALHQARLDARGDQRLVTEIFESVLLVWYSGDSGPAGRGSLMVFRVRDGHSSNWFVGLRADREWRPGHCRGIRAEEFDRLLGDFEIVEPFVPAEVRPPEEGETRESDDLDLEDEELELDDDDEAADDAGQTLEDEEPAEQSDATETLDEDEPDPPGEGGGTWP